MKLVKTKPIQIQNKIYINEKLEKLMQAIEKRTTNRKNLKN